jgi:branched-subunit amino acid transport protein
MNSKELWTLSVIVALALVTLLTRCFFLFSGKDWHLPDWVQRGLQYAPIAALAAVIAPEILLTQGQLPSTWKDARLFGAAVGLAWYFWRRGASQAVLGTIVLGMTVYLLLHLGWGW